MDRQRDWVHRFNEEGPDGLTNRKGAGRTRYLSDVQMKERQIVETGPDPAVDGVVRWRRIDLKRVVISTGGRPASGNAGWFGRSTPLAVSALGGGFAATSARSGLSAVFAGGSFRRSFLQDVDVVGQPVEKRGKAFRAEGAGPFIERQVGRHNG